ncbi:glycosyltransferase family 1 protein [Sphingomonas sp.]|uniref:glycosyltransferase family 4 protein n=1 Tax=Sphingomonas sp. TaxID=28214 RepID=UPI00286A3017|nr:glycosyltransferase family 1 protein [Sphingomonas sp.]
MRVGLNATCFNDRPSGARQRFVGLYSALIRQCADIRFTIYEPSDCAVARWFDGAPNVTAIRTPMPSGSRLRRSVGGINYWRKRLSEDRIDLFETFNLPLPATGNCPVIVTIHDIRSMLPDQRWPQRGLARAIHRQALRRASAVLTVSETMRQDLLAIDPESRVIAIPNGLKADAFAAQAGDDERVRRLCLPDDYLLAVGHFEPRKNYRRLVEAVGRLRTTHPERSLVIVGNDGGSLSDLRTAVGELGMADAVQLRQNVADDELRLIYRNARLVLFPSTYEGFGIPVLEAMAAGRPLVVSDLPVFRELIGPRGAYFPPQDVTNMADAVAAVLASPERQRQLVDDGRQRVRDFTFDRLASEVEAVYREVLTQRRASTNWGRS